MASLWRRPGEVRDATVEFLRGGRSDAPAFEILDAVRSSVGAEVPASSVRSYLRLNVGMLFQRKGRGRYRLRE